SALCSAQYKYSPTTPMLVCMAILSLLYILLCLAVLVIAVLYLLSLFGIPNVHPNNFWRALLSLFSFVPVCLISLAFSCSAIYARKVSLASPAIVTLCAVALFFAGAISVAYLFGDVKKRPNPIPKILTTALTIVLIVGAFAPAFHCDVWGTFRGRETPTTVTIQEGYSYFNSLVLTEDQVNSLEDQWEDTDVDFKESTKSAVSFLFYRSVKNIKAGFGSYDNRSVLRSLETGYRMFDYYPLFALIPVCMLSAVIFALLIIRQALVSSCVTPKKRFRSPLVFKILLVVSLVIALSIMIVYLSTLSQRITRYQLHDYSIGISGGIIVALSVSALLFFVPANERLSNKRKAPRDRNFYTVFGEEEAVTEEAVN
ncbi:MAG: hypothetical protein IJC29_00415, partial [Clostridia bacterium]|nr:hypothetical protein [Clostridia bacterium]